MFILNIYIYVVTNFKADVLTLTPFEMTLIKTIIYLTARFWFCLLEVHQLFFRYAKQCLRAIRFPIFLSFF